MARAKKHSETSTQAAVYVVAGKDAALVNYQCRELLDRLMPHEQRTTGLFEPDIKQAALSEVLDELRTMPFLTDRRVVVLRNADEFVSEHRERLENYFDHPSSTGVLVLTVSSWPAGTRLARKLPSVGQLISVGELKQWEIPARLMEYAQQTHGKKLSKQTAEILIEVAGEELVGLYNEIDKLAVYARDDKVITISHVEALVGHNRLFNAFAVIDAVTAGDAAAAVGRLRKMFAEDKSTEYTVVGAFAYHFRRQFQAKVLLEEGRSAMEVSKRCNIWASKDAFFGQLKRLSLYRIGQCLVRLAEIDHAIKTGRTTPQVAIERLVLSLAS